LCCVGIYTQVRLVALVGGENTQDADRTVR